MNAARTDASVPRPITAHEFEMARRVPNPALLGLVSSLTGYREQATGHFRQFEAASLDVPLVISFGAPFSIGLGRKPTASDCIGSFAAGLFAGPVVIDSCCGAECIQINFTPLGARRFFHFPMTELAERMVTLDDVLGRDGIALRNELAEETRWERRFELVEHFVMERIAEAPDGLPAVDYAFRRIVEAEGRLQISVLAAEIGWSRKHLAQRFAAEIGLGPKAIGRIVRFNRALAAATDGSSTGWADLAAACGYADQAHLAREFRDLAGATPSDWLARIQLASR